MPGYHVLVVGVPLMRELRHTDHEYMAPGAYYVRRLASNDPALNDSPVLSMACSVSISDGA